MNVEATFKNVVGREMTPDEVTRYLKLQKEFEIPDTDAIWMMFIWFEYYQRIFEQFPEKARVEAVEVARSLREASVAVTSATSAEVKASREQAAREIVKMQEAAKVNIANALGGTLENEIRNAVGRLQSQSNRPLHKKWLIAMVVVLPIAVGLGGWGVWTLSNHYEKLGYDSKASLNETIRKDWPSFLNCTWPGWEIRTENGKKWCFPFANDPKTGSAEGWRIK